LGSGLVLLIEELREGNLEDPRQKEGEEHTEVIGHRLQEGPLLGHKGRGLLKETTS